MQVLRQIATALAQGAVTALSQTNDYADQVVDVNSRMILKLLADGKFTSGFSQVAASGSLALALPQNYLTTNSLHFAFATDQTVRLTWTDAGGTRRGMVRAGLATDQPGLAVFCGPLTVAPVVDNQGATTANVEWFMFELPAITTNAGWRDGALATGLSSP